MLKYISTYLTYILNLNVESCMVFGILDFELNTSYLKSEYDVIKQCKIVWLHPSKEITILFL